MKHIAVIVILLVAALELGRFLVIAQGFVLKDLPVVEIARNTLPLMVIAVATLPSAAWLFRKKSA